jgi:uncharacterized membrane protein
MKILVLTLRLVHILSGVFWVGSSVFLGFFVTPTVAAISEAGQKFMAHLVTRARITGAITISAILTVLAGSWLYWIDSNGFTSKWTSAGPGWGFGIGGLLGFIGLAFGFLVGKNVGILGNLAAQIQGPPNPEQLGKIQAAQKQLKVVAPISTFALILALICMATARYWGL